MPDFLRKLIGLLLLLTTVGAVSCQALTTHPGTELSRPSLSAPYR